MDSSPDQNPEKCYQQPIPLLLCWLQGLVIQHLIKDHQGEPLAGHTVCAV